MSTVGYGVGGAVGTASESTPGTGVAPSVWHQFVSESIKGQRPIVEQASITGDRSVTNQLPGIRSAAGDLSLEFDGNSFGQLFYYFNGNGTGAYTSSAVAGFISSAPTYTVGAGGSVPVATYRYLVVPIWLSVLDARKYLGPASAAVSGVAVTAGNNTVNLTWGAPGTPPTGFSYYGTAIYRTTGAAGTEQLVAVQVGTGNTYSDTAAAVDTGLYSAPGTLVGTPREHVFTRGFVPGVDPLPAFSTTVVKGNDASERYLLCKINTFELTVGEGNKPIALKFGLMARDYEKITPNPTPSYTNLSKGMSWQTLIGINGTFQEIVEGLTIQGSNNCEMIPGLSGQARNRDVGYGLRQIGGSLSRQFETHQFWDYMRAGCRFSLQSIIYGQPLGGVNCNTQFPISGQPVELLSYMAIFDLPRCALSDAGANIGGPGRMTEQIQFKTEVDPNSGTELKVRLINLTAAYS